MRKLYFKALKYKPDVKCIAPRCAYASLPRFGFSVSAALRSNCQGGLHFQQLIFETQMSKETQTSKRRRQWMCGRFELWTINDSLIFHARLLSFDVLWAWLYHKGEGFSRHLEFSAVSAAFSEQSINHYPSVEKFIPGPQCCFPVGPPYQCSAVMLFNWKHKNTLSFKILKQALASVHSYFLPYAVCLWHFCFHAVVVEAGLQAHTMGRPGAAHVPAGWPRPVPSYSAIVTILGDGGGVSLTVILRGYFYRKHQLEKDWVTKQNSTSSSQTVNP